MSEQTKQQNTPAAGAEGRRARSKSGEQCFDTCRQCGSRGGECSRHAGGGKNAAQAQ